MQNKISIILITRNSKSVLYDCLNSLDNDDEITSSKNAQWIIVDNDSNDGSVEEAASLYPNTLIIKNKENTGFAKAANQGFNVAVNDYILYINTDTKLKKNAITKLYETISKNKDIAVIGPRLIRKNETIQKSVYPEPTIWTEIFKPVVKVYVSLKEKFYKKDKCYTVGSLRGACFIADRQKMKNVGCFDERYFFYLEETDLFRRLRMSKDGGKICYLPASEIYHYGGLGCDDKMSFDKRKIYTESLLKYFNKHRNKFENFMIKFLVKNK